MAANVFAERYLFLPSMGFCGLLAGGCVFLFRQLRGHRQLWRWVLATTAAIVLLLAAGEIVARNRDWHDDFTLLAQTLAIEPHAAYMRTNLGVLAWDAHNPAEAERQWRMALADAPNSPVTLSDLGLAMLEKKRYSDAENYLHKAIELRPNFAAPHLHLARVYAAENDNARAEAELRRAVEIYPFSTQARNALGQFYFDAGNLAQAEVQFRASVEDLPNPGAWDRLGDIYMREGLAEKAEQAWRQSLELSDFDAQAHRSLGNLYFAAGRDAEAEKQYRSVLVFDPNDPDALRALRKMHPQEFPVALH
jgi:tetratricopeptide (TPR) repeat protein